MPLICFEKDIAPDIAITRSLNENIAALETEKVQVWVYTTSSQKIISIESINDNSMYVNEPNKTSRKRLAESFTQPSRNSFLKQKLEELNNIYALLKYENSAVFEIAVDVIKDSLTQNKLDIKISRTGENELLIFREREGIFNNIIIDEDGDIEFLHIPINRSETYNEHHSFINNIDTFSLVSKL